MGRIVTARQHCGLEVEFPLRNLSFITVEGADLKTETSEATVRKKNHLNAFYKERK